MPPYSIDGIDLLFGVFTVNAVLLLVLLIRSLRADAKKDTAKSDRTETASRRMTIHFSYVVGILLSVIVLFITRWLVNTESAVAFIGFAATIASLILSVLAIIYAYLSGQSLTISLAQIQTTSEALARNAGKIELISEVLTNVQRLHGRLESVQEDLKKAQSAAITPAGNNTTQSAPAVGMTQEQWESLIDKTIELTPWNGLKVLLACKLGSDTGLPFSLRLICDQRMSWDFAIAYLIACRSFGLFLLEITPTESFVVSRFIPRAQQKLDQVIGEALKDGRIEADEKRLRKIEVANIYSRFNRIPVADHAGEA